MADNIFLLSGLAMPLEYFPREVVSVNICCSFLGFRYVSVIVNLCWYALHRIDGDDEIRRVRYVRMLVPGHEYLN